MLEKAIYTEQINKVQDYIEKHLDRPLKVDELSKIASFSSFHFQRIYMLMTGESIYGFIKRLRLEKAAYMLMADKKRSVIDIAMSVGFSNQASFAKAFKARYGVTSSYYRKSKTQYDASAFMATTIDYRDMAIDPLSVVIKREEALQLIYVRYSGPYKGDGDLFTGLFQKLYFGPTKDT